MALLHRWKLWVLLLGLVCVVAACRRPDPALMRLSPAALPASSAPVVDRSYSERKYIKPSDADLKERLEPLEYAVTQRAATEPPFHNRYFDSHEEGLYVDAASGEPLFSSRDKFDSGTGWPSFWQPLSKVNVAESGGGSRMFGIEVHCARCDGHLGHVFEDGPKPTGLRYCINSVSIDFAPRG